MNDMKLTPAGVLAAANNDFENFIVAATPGGIEAQEKRGQESFVNSETLPKRFSYSKREDLEAASVKFGEDVDDLFVRVELPTGWKKVRTDHSMWSKLVDEQGRERASIFYKAAFYDRDAHISLKSRYSIDVYGPCDEAGNAVEWRTETHYRTTVQDAGRVIHVVAIRDKDDKNDIQDSHYAAAQAWLNEHYPEWKSHAAYWNVTAAVQDGA